MAIRYHGQPKRRQPCHVRRPVATHSACKRTNRRWPNARKGKMIPGDASAIAARLMSEFAMRTGLLQAAQHLQRYLWTDAFAVCNFLELFARTSDQTHRRCAMELIDQVHQVLGRYRDDDIRSGWISGFDEQTGRHHPTAGGLRIGKPLKERDADEPLDERLEWDRDGQYFHYLTKWMHALCQAGFATGNIAYVRWAVELGQAAFAGFTRRAASGRVIGLHWKMSIDLSRPLVAAMGMHDALDGFITFRELQHAATMSSDAGANDLSEATRSLAALCQDRDWMTDDPLGIGGLLFDACRLVRLIDEERYGDLRLLESLLDACHHGLAVFLAGGSLNASASQRLAFRELGLAIGLRGLPILADAMKTIKGYGRGPALQQLLEPLLRYGSLGEGLVNFWLPHAQHDQSWKAHEDINDVMLATALTPELFLSTGERTPFAS